MYRNRTHSSTEVQLHFTIHICGASFPIQAWLCCDYLLPLLCITILLLSVYNYFALKIPFILAPNYKPVPRMHQNLSEVMSIYKPQKTSFVCAARGIPARECLQLIPFSAGLDLNKRSILVQIVYRVCESLINVFSLQNNQWLLIKITNVFS